MDKEQAYKELATDVIVEYVGLVDFVQKANAIVQKRTQHNILSPVMDAHLCDKLTEFIDTLSALENNVDNAEEG